MALTTIHMDDRRNITPKMTQALQNKTKQNSENLHRKNFTYWSHNGTRTPPPALGFYYICNTHIVTSCSLKMNMEILLFFQENTIKICVTSHKKWSSQPPLTHNTPCAGSSGRGEALRSCKPNATPQPTLIKKCNIHFPSRCRVQSLTGRTKETVWRHPGH